MSDGAGPLIMRGLEARNKPLVATLVEEARRVSVEGDEVRFEFAPEKKTLRDTLSKPDNQKLRREVCCEVLGRAVGVSVTVASAGGSDDDPFAREDEDRREQRRLREVAESNPLVQEVLKKFRGEIVEVRPAESAKQTPPPDGPIQPNRPGAARV